MKIIFALLTLFASSQTLAWTKIIDCNNGELVVDQGNNDPLGRPTYQLVLRGTPLNYFIQAGAVDPHHLNAVGEFILDVNTYDGELMGFLSYQAPADRPHSYRSYWIHRRNGEVLLRSTIGNRYEGQSEKANWQFHNCK